MSTTIAGTTLFCRQPERWRTTLTSGGLIDLPHREVTEIVNGTLLPMRWKPGSKGRFVDGLLEGGVIDAKGNFVAGLKRSIGDKPVNRTCVGGYEFNPIDLEYRDEEVVYGGVLAGAWGHMLVDATSRLWYAQEARKNNHKVVFSIIPNQTLTHPTLLHLAGLPEGTYEIIERPTQFKKITVPASSVFLKSGCFTKKWITVFDTIRENALAKADKRIDRPCKIYLSRTQYEYQNIIGEEYFERFFANHGYKPVYLEQLPLAEQIALLANAQSVATTMGTLAHMALFCKDKTELIILNRSRTIVDTQVVINNARHLRCTLVDAFASFLPDRQTTGCPTLIAPGREWEEFARDSFGEGPDADYRANEFPSYVVDYIGKWGDFYSGQWGFNMIRNCGIRDVVALTNEVFNSKSIDPETLPEPVETTRLRAEIARLKMQIEELSQARTASPIENRTRLVDSARVDAVSWSAKTLAIGGILYPAEEAETSIAPTKGNHNVHAALILIANGNSEYLCPITLECTRRSSVVWSAAASDRSISQALSALYAKEPFYSASLAIRIKLADDLTVVDVLPIGSDCDRTAAHSFWKHNVFFGIHAARSRWKKGDTLSFDIIGIKDIENAVRKLLR